MPETEEASTMCRTPRSIVKKGDPEGNETKLEVRLGCRTNEHAQNSDQRPAVRDPLNVLLSPS